MAKVGKLLRSATNGILMFYCPGCRFHHGVWVKGIYTGMPVGAYWEFNGNYDAPTFSPSLLVRSVKPLSDEQRERLFRGETITRTELVCHTFIRDGKIQYLNDCTHELAGQTIDMESAD